MPVQLCQKEFYSIDACSQTTMPLTSGFRAGNFAPNKKMGALNLHPMTLTRAAKARVQEPMTKTNFGVCTL